ncbi:hypothetical protein [Photobacterium sanctipauli]|uniref:hypothetical protein n=1 Tax=Photobacterium sanctipauli TaxID=1342794 RepID=UPI000564C03A|nr:hypothetical protein [Photobacterium sanctipauli]
MFEALFLPHKTIEQTSDINIPVINGNLPAKLKLRYKKGKLKANLHFCTEEGKEKLNLFYPQIASEFERQTQKQFKRYCQSRYLPNSLITSEVTKWLNHNAQMFVSYDGRDGLNLTEHKRGGVRVKAKEKDLEL